MNTTYTDWLNQREAQAKERKALRSNLSVPDAKEVVPHPGSLNRAQRRAQGRYEGFLTPFRTPVKRVPDLVKLSGRNRWTKRAVTKVLGVDLKTYKQNRTEEIDNET